MGWSIFGGYKSPILKEQGIKPEDPNALKEGETPSGTFIELAVKPDILERSAIQVGNELIFLKNIKVNSATSQFFGRRIDNASVLLTKDQYNAMKLSAGRDGNNYSLYRLNDIVKSSFERADAASKEAEAFVLKIRKEEEAAQNFVIPEPNIGDKISAKRDEIDAIPIDKTGRIVDENYPDQDEVDSDKASIR